MIVDVDHLRDHSVAVIGDLVLDCYVSGSVSRISPEAPVPVLRVNEERFAPGGSANIAVNLASLGLQAMLVGFTGLDAARESLVAALSETPLVHVSGILPVPLSKTTRHVRLIGDHQQMARVDHEDLAPYPKEAYAGLLEAARAAIDASDVVVLSDQGKGVCSDELVSPLIAYATFVKKSVLVDPDRGNWQIYRGACALVTNRTELTHATGLPCETDEEAWIAARYAQEKCGADLFLTRSGKGISFFPLEGIPIHLPTAEQDVFDVSGAGETVVAVLAAALAAQMPVYQCMRLANHAAGIVVSKLGTASVTREELSVALNAESANSDVRDGSLLEWDKLIAIRGAWAKEKLSVGLLVGSFDLIQPAHVSLVAEAASQCDRLIVALRSDASLLDAGIRPTQDHLARADVVGAMKSVAAVVILPPDMQHDGSRLLHPDALFREPDDAPLALRR